MSQTDSLHCCYCHIRPTVDCTVVTVIFDQQQTALLLLSYSTNSRLCCCYCHIRPTVDYTVVTVIFNQQYCAVVTVIFDQQYCAVVTVIFDQQQITLLLLSYSTNSRLHCCYCYIRPTVDYTVVTVIFDQQQITLLLLSYLTNSTVLLLLSYSTNRRLTALMLLKKLIFYHLILKVTRQLSIAILEAQL